MRRRLYLATAAAAVLAFPPAAGAADQLSFRASISPRTHLFGDPIVAELQAVAPADAAKTMRVETDFAPYTVTGPVEVERLRAGGQTQVRWRWHLECLTRACLPGETQRRVVFGPARIKLPIAGKEQLATAIWPVVTVRSRLSPDDRARPEPRASIYPVGASTARVEPASLSRILRVAAGLLALAAVVVLLPFVRRLPRPRSRFDRLGSAERALVLARRAAARSDTARRRTSLERLGRELARSGSPDLADEATRLAWGELPPDGAAMERLLGRAEHELGGAT